MFEHLNYTDEKSVRFWLTVMGEFGIFIRHRLWNGPVAQVVRAHP
jgi:hypothetical protein